MPPEPVRARTWKTRLRPTTSPTSVSETERERIHFSFLVCPPSHDDEKYDAVEGACQGGRSQDCRQRQGDRIILTRLLILSHSAFSAASTKTPHERRRAQVCTPGPGRVSTPVR